MQAIAIATFGGPGNLRLTDLPEPVPAAGKLHVSIGHEFPLADAANAHRCIAGGRTKGKLLLRI